MKQIHLGLLFLALLALTTACTITSEPETHSAVAVVTTEPSVTPTSLPSHTPQPTATHTPEPTSTQTGTPTHTPTPIPTPEVLDRFESPDGQWVATLKGLRIPRSYSASYTFFVRSQDGEIEWIVESFGYDRHSLIGYDKRIPIYWSESGQYMYYIHHGSNDGCGPYIYGYALYRLDLQTGETLALVTEGHWFAVAPNEERVAYILDGALVIHDIATSEEVTLALQHDPAIEYVNFSDLTWSPDSHFLLIFGAEDVCATGMLFEHRTFIIKLDTQSYLQSVIVEGDRSLWGIVAWPEPNKVQVNIDRSLFWLDPETGEITPAEE